MIREEARQIIADWLESSKWEKGQLGYIEGWFQESDVEAFRMAIEALQDNWIPVSDDTLPDEDVDVNVTIKDFAETQTGFLSGEDWWLITKEGMLESYPLEYVIAWQPLPEPYKGGDK